ncbi:hypothetical protein PG991_015859 [Apiospora marii]|uniref:Nephrocystin 3-like N-terminal domain-containing protein n=1 Tax=Apiospora marii TaxID=335849 RepID=A0ABR1R024_9PEZI
MARIVARIGQLRWEVALSKALDEFENGLTTEQKAGFQAIRDHASESPPTIRDVMNLTAEVDYKARQRCFGPRFTRILESVQQYAAIGDVIAGGSQNLMACSVWSLVRMCLLVCQRSMQICQQQSIIYQVRSFIQDGDLSRYESDLDRQADAIKDQLRIEHTRTTSSMYDAVRSLNAAYRRGKDTEKYLKHLDLCSTYDYKSAWKRLRELGTTKSILSEEGYNEWLHSQQKESLVIRGKLGSGKSVLLANMVDDVNLKQPETTTAYFFCCEDDIRSLNCRTILGCFARQIIQLLPPEKVAEHSHRLFADMQTDHVVECLMEMADKEKRLVLILDGLEACAKQERVELLGALERLQDSLNAAVCMSCSIGAGNESEVDMRILKQRRFATLPDDRPEIRAFVKARLLEKLESGELCLGDPRLILDIEQVLKDDYQGMFLWVHMQIEAICLEKSDASIRQALGSLPRSFPEIFQRILDNRKHLAEKHQTPALQLLGATLRPLLLDEFEEAISVVPGDTDITQHRINDVGSVLASCGSLIILDEEQSTLHFTHHSVRSYVLGQFHDTKGSERSASPFSQAEANSLMSQIIITYLSWEGFNSQVSTVRAPPLSVGSMPVRIVGSIPKRNKKLQMLAMKLLNGEMKSVDLTVDIVSRSARFSNTAVTQFSFLKYAQTYWLHHTKKADEDPSELFRLFQDLVWKTELVENASLWKDQPSTATRPVNKQCAWARYHSHGGFLKVYGTNLAIEDLIDAERDVKESLGKQLLAVSDLYRFLISHHSSLMSTLDALLLAIEETNAMPRHLQQWESCCEFIETQLEQVLQRQRGLYKGIFETLRINTWKIKDCPDRWVKVLDNYFTQPIHRLTTCWKQLKVSLARSMLPDHASHFPFGHDDTDITLRSKDILRSTEDPLIRSAVVSSASLMCKISSKAELLYNLVVRLEETQDLLARLDQCAEFISHDFGQLQLSGCYEVTMPDRNPEMCEIYLFEAHLLTFSMRSKPKTEYETSDEDCVQLHLKDKIKLEAISDVEASITTAGKAHPYAGPTSKLIENQECKFFRSIGLISQFQHPV